MRRKYQPLHYHEQQPWWLYHTLPLGIWHGGVWFGTLHFVASTPRTKTTGKHMYFLMSANTGGRWSSATFWGMLRLQREKREKDRHTHTQRQKGAKKSSQSIPHAAPYASVSNPPASVECKNFFCHGLCAYRTSSRGWGNGLLITVATTTHFSSLDPWETPCCQNFWIDLCFIEYSLK